MRKILLTCLFLWSLSTVAEAKQLIPMGHSIGIQLQLPHLYVTHDVLLPEGVWLKQGDKVMEMNSQKVTKLEQLDDITGDVKMVVERKNKSLHFQLTSAELKNMLPFLKDETDGIGTLTFIDPDSKEFGALGHQIIDMTLKEAPVFDEGGIYMASISQVKKSEPGQPGYKISVIDPAATRLGNIVKNDVYGIFGNWEQALTNSVRQSMEIIHAADVELGEAQIYTAIEGTDVKAYTIHIDNKKDDTFQFTVKDTRLIEKTGGILQGMSGSPVIQNGQFVGAVTHMYVEKPTKGAGLFIIEMLKKTPR
ncbi:MAG: SpoIVB peptidase S55 domain-containing protein [Solibacillus sp.]